MIAGLPTPVELGFPDKFAQWRPDQLQAIDRTVRSGKRVISATAPTGFGKTLYGIATALLHPDVRRALYLTSTKNLQDQIEGDFQGLGLLDIRGQRNYPCTAVDKGAPLERFRRHRGYTGCDEGPCHAGVRCSKAGDRMAPQIRPECVYYGKVHDARIATLVSTNYAFWLSQGAYAQGLGDFDLLILDEAHHAPDELESFLTFELTAEDAQYLRSRLVDSDEISHWRDWAQHHYGTLAAHIEQRELMPPQEAEGAKEMRKLKGILTKLGRLKEIDPNDWIIERETVKRVKFSPMRVGRYAEEFLFRGVPKILLTSATLTRKTLTLLGLDPTQCEVMEFKSSFPIERRPVIAIETFPSVRVNARMHDTTKVMWMRRIDRLIESRRNRKGLIHTVSYARMMELYQFSDHKDLMITHSAGEANYALQALKDHDGPIILVSPSMETGIDLPYEDCRYQIIGKVPIPDTRGKIMQIRTQLDPDYSFYIAAQKLVQATGRPMRAADDWAETFIVDDTFGDWFLNRARKFMPHWFLDAIEFADVLPEPLVFPERIQTAA